MSNLTLPELDSSPYPQNSAVSSCVFTQYLPLGKTLFVVGTMPKSARRDKLFIITINPAIAVMAMQKLNQPANKSPTIKIRNLLLI
ncbi:hypothetical protein ES754_10800 [Psychrobacter frigidicola]|uniref:Uncharacterized protein n=1 Tax=Psychrobacter frigidicola TaxID=45611 RepID=A0A5C6ZYL2_9GAMM|nr:hypothetical protein [Psychrobacter frigidicola]TXD96117.1 hypothetical protein ES754_10800 [Psychrobacter frigidicola]